MNPEADDPAAPSDPLAAAAIAAALDRVSEEQWARLWAAVDAIEADGSPATWRGGEVTGTVVVEGVERPVRQMPYPVYSARMEQVLDLIRELGLIVPFDWPDWDGLERYRGGAGLTDAPAADAVRMITAIVRSERFCDGSIEGAWMDGTFPAALACLRAHVTADPRRTTQAPPVR